MGAREGEGGEGEGYCKAAGIQVFFFPFSFETRFQSPCSGGVYSKSRGSVYMSLSPAGNTKRELLKLSKRQNKYTVGRRG